MFSRSHPVLMALGLIIWIIWFVLIYSTLSVACAVAPPPSAYNLTWLNGFLLILTILTTLLLIYLSYRSAKKAKTVLNKTHEHHFILWVAAGGFLAASIATLSIGMMALLYSPCR